MKVGPTATKKSVLEELLEQGMVLVALDARVEGVDVPSHLHQDPQLRLNLSYRFGLPMDVAEWGVAATLTFAGVPFECRIPWTAIFLLVSHVSGQPYLFPDDIPAELLSAGDAAEGLQRAARVEPQRPKLTLVSGDAGSDAEAPEADISAEANRLRTASDQAGKPDPDEVAVPSVARSIDSPTDDAEAPRRPNAELGIAVEPALSRYASDDKADVDVQVADNESSKNPRRPRGRGHLRLVK